MAIAVGNVAPVKVIDNVLSLREETIRNDGPNPVVISKDPQVTATSADGFSVAVNASQDVSLEIGEGLYAICAAGQTASVEVV